ncbi:GIY-YIG nuclease family protein [uncultured Roseivirga sp.]|uniref:GIY-YIG nuclease family protein n=1 Tax=uncultured Roseivirga sp. TaxID=543088 RepID=UPI0030DD0F31|tara:strand:- start:76255 stop:77493 length:1239 start_codon:yes stop_codon:yes gene_type:complete
MDKDKILDDIFENDPLGLLVIKAKKSNAQTADDRLVSSFDEINKFVSEQGKEPEPNISNVSEFQLYSRLKNIREDESKASSLKQFDTHNLLPSSNEINEPEGEYRVKKKEINSIDDLLSSAESLDILGGDDEGLFDFKHTPREVERAEADFVARRKPCKNFEDYEPLFKSVQRDLSQGKRKLIDFNRGNLRESSYYIHNGILFYLEEIKIEQTEHYKSDGTRVREDGRTRCIFENGTESNMLKRSVEKILYANGRVVTDNFEELNEGFLENFGVITEEDEEAGFIYVLKSKSKRPEIQSYKHLYKIGFSRTDVEDRIRNAHKEPTYLMDEVEYVAGWKGFNMNPQKLELLLHNFFGSSCLDIEITDEKGRIHRPREWFLAPLPIVEQAIALIISGKVVEYLYDAQNETIIPK